MTLPIFNRRGWMVAWCKKWWPVLVLCALAVAILDATLSTLLTCHPASTNPGKGAEAQQHKEHCTALAGPVLTTFEAFVDFFEGHGEAVTAVFTIVLAAFTGTLWSSTNKLWRAARDESDIVSGAVAYNFPMARSMHVTPFMYAVARKDGAVINPPDQTVEILQRDLSIVRMPIGRSPT